MQANVDTRVSSSRRLQLKVCDDRRVRLRVGPSWGREPPPYNERGLKAQRQQALTLLGTHPVVEIWLMALTLYCTTPQLGFSLSVQRQPALMLHLSRARYARPGTILQTHTLPTAVFISNKKQSVSLNACALIKIRQ